MSVIFAYKITILAPVTYFATYLEFTIFIIGSILTLGDDYSLRLKIINIQTAQIMNQRMYTVRPDNVLLSLANQPTERPIVANEPRNETSQQVIMSDVNIKNNNTTTIHGYVNRPN